MDDHTHSMADDHDYGAREDCAEAGSLHAAALDSVAAAQERVLIVDDNHNAAESLAMLVELLGNEAQVAYDGASALAMVDEFRPAIVLLDLTMPGMSGFDVARALRARAVHSGMRIVALSGRSEDDTRRQTREAGFDDHVVKPVDLPTLTALLAGSAPT